MELDLHFFKETGCSRQRTRWRKWPIRMEIGNSFYNELLRGNVPLNIGKEIEDFIESFKKVWAVNNTQPTNLPTKEIFFGYSAYNQKYNRLIK